MKGRRFEFLLPLIAIISLVLVLGVVAARAGELPAGEPLETNGLQIMAVYLQPVVMEPGVAGEDAASSDIHLELDVRALPDNTNGFPEGAWVPYLEIAYALTKKGSDWTKSGALLPMVANDGPHYGSNIKLDGPGAYGIVFRIGPPSGSGFLRHTDKETGVGPWWPSFAYRGEFKFVGTGKKGGY